jgi:hypothetical protein
MPASTLVARLAFLAFLALPAASLRGQEAGAPTLAAPPPSAPLFSSDEPLAFRIDADFRQLRRDRDQESEERPGTVTLADAPPLPVQVRTRGNFRLRNSTCRFPPLRLNFPKKALAGTVLDGEDKLKLVTHCRDSDNFEQNVLEEYLAYRIYNLVTDSSFRVRLARVTYVDAAGEEDTVERWGFLIEDDDALAERLGGTVLEAEQVHPARFTGASIGPLELFQYLIGNTDFSMIAGAKDDICCHNVVLFSDGSEQYIPVPYDFDFAGLVNARYAKPNPNLPIKRVTSRLYRGNCMHNAYVDDALSQITAQRQAVHDLMSAIPGLTDRSREVALRYIGDFFSTVTDPGDVEKRLLRKCS